MSSEMRVLIEAGNKLLAAMEMQEGRESEALHIAQPTAKHLWDEAKTAWNRALLARTEAGPSLLCQSDACAHKGTVHNFCTPRTEAGADGADTFAEWLATEMPAGTVIGNPAWWANRIARQYRVRSGITHPQDASGDAENSRRYLKLKELFRARFHRSTSDYWVIEGECKTDPRFFGEDAEQLTLDAALDAMQAKEAK